MVCRRFGTLYQFHIQGLDVKYEVYFIIYIQPLKMELIEGSETSANHNRTPGKYPKEYIHCPYLLIEHHGVWGSDVIGPRIIISFLEDGEYSSSSSSLGPVDNATDVLQP